MNVCAQKDPNMRVGVALIKNIGKVFIKQSFVAEDYFPSFSAPAESNLITFNVNRQPISHQVRECDSLNAVMNSVCVSSSC